MSLDILPLSTQTSNILIGISIFIVMISLIFAVIILFRNDKHALSANKVEYDLNSTKVPYVDEEKVLYEEHELLAEISPQEEGDIAAVSAVREAIAPPAENPVSFICSELQISPATARRAQQVEISCKVTNTSDAADSYHAALLINGAEVSRQIISLSPGATKKVIFIGSEQTPGTYTIELCNLKGILIISD